MFKFTKALVASTIIAGAVFAAPVAANAAPAYPPTVNGSANGATVAPGGTFTVAFPDGTFTPSSPISITITSTGPVPTDATLGVFRAAQVTVNGNSNVNGGATLRGTVPSNATAPITVTATDLATGNTVTAAINVTAAAGAASVTSSGSGLATTGTYISLATIWGAVGLVAVGGGFIAIRTMSRRKQAESGAHTV